MVKGRIVSWLLSTVPKATLEAVFPKTSVIFLGLSEIEDSKIRT